MTTTTLPRFVPPDLTQSERTEHGIVYYTLHHPRHGLPSAMGFKGRSGKRSFYFRFANEAKMREHIARFFTGLKQQAENVLNRRQERTAVDASAHFAVGDIVYNSWGWEQTNIDFYKVIKVHKNSVTLQGIADERTYTSSMTGTCVPCPDVPARHNYNLRNDELDISRHGVHTSGNRAYLSFKHGSGSKWEGRPMGWSSYA